jgi:hypothetical protein
MTTGRRTRPTVWLVCVMVAVGAMTVAVRAEPALAASCKLPKAPVEYGEWRVTSFSRDAKKLIKPPAGRVVMSLAVEVSNTGGTPAASTYLDINLIPKGSRKYRGTIIRGESEAAKTLKPNETVAFTLVYPIELKDKAKAMSVQLADFGRGPSEDLLVPICR